MVLVPTLCHAAHVLYVHVLSKLVASSLHIFNYWKKIVLKFLLVFFSFTKKLLCNAAHTLAASIYTLPPQSSPQKVQVVHVRLRNYFERPATVIVFMALWLGWLNKEKDEQFIVSTISGCHFKAVTILCYIIADWGMQALKWTGSMYCYMVTFVSCNDDITM